MSIDVKGIGEWLATSPLATALKAAAVAALAWVMANIQSFDLHPILIVAIAAAIPVVIDSLNSQDKRFGVGSGEAADDKFDVFEESSNEQ